MFYLPEHDQPARELLGESHLGKIRTWVRACYIGPPLLSGHFPNTL